MKINLNILNLPKNKKIKSVKATFRNAKNGGLELVPASKLESIKRRRDLKNWIKPKKWLC